MSPPSTDITGSKLVEHHTLPQTVPWMGHCHRHEEQGYQIAPLKERTFKLVSHTLHLAAHLSHVQKPHFPQI